MSAATEPPGTEPAGTEPPGTEPPGTEPAGTEPAGRVKGIDRDLDVLFTHIMMLREVHAHPDANREGVYDFAVRWGTYLSGRLPRLHHYYTRGRLTAEERERYEALLAEFRAVLPLVEDLGLARPHEALDDAETVRKRRRARLHWH